MRDRVLTLLGGLIVVVLAVALSTPAQPGGRGLSGQLSGPETKPPKKPPKKDGLSGRLSGPETKPPKKPPKIAKKPGSKKCDPQAIPTWPPSSKKTGIPRFNDTQLPWPSQGNRADFIKTFKKKGHGNLVKKFLEGNDKYRQVGQQARDSFQGGSKLSEAELKAITKSPFGLIQEYVGVLGGLEDVAARGRPDNYNRRIGRIVAAARINKAGMVLIRSLAQTGVMLPEQSKKLSRLGRTEQWVVKSNYRKGLSHVIKAYGKVISMYRRWKRLDPSFRLSDRDRKLLSQAYNNRGTAQIRLATLSRPHFGGKAALKSWLKSKPEKFKLFTRGFQRAIRGYVEAIKVDPCNSLARDNLVKALKLHAQHLAAMDKPVQARACQLKAIEISRTSNPGNYNYASLKNDKCLKGFSSGRRAAKTKRCPRRSKSPTGRLLHVGDREDGCK